MPENPFDEFTEAFGEPISRVLNMETWRDGADMTAFYDRMRQEVAESVQRERDLYEPMRAAIMPLLRGRNDAYAPAAAGLYTVLPGEIAEIHRHVLFNGATECCDGTVASHDSLVLSVIQIGISLVAYQGHQGTWVQRLYRRDLRAHYPNRVDEVVALLQQRMKRSDSQTNVEEEERDPLTRLVRRALMEYAERAALTELSTAVWRMGHGNPIPINMLVPTTPELVRAGLDTLRRLIFEHRRFIYVVSESTDKLLLTIGNALKPLQFAVVGTLADYYHDGRLAKLRDNQRGHPQESALIQDFIREARLEVVSGVYRAGLHAPARVFYAHKDFACEAAAIAIADSTLQPYRGFPMLIDLADHVCGNTFDQASFHGSLQDAYAAAGEPTRYLGERETRA